MSEPPTSIEEGASVPQPPQRFTVTPSPLNRVKLELAAVLVVALTLYALVEVLLETGWLQVLVLGLYGLIAGAWLTLRARRVVTAAVSPPSDVAQ